MLCACMHAKDWIGELKQFCFFMTFCIPDNIFSIACAAGRFQSPSPSLLLCFNVRGHNDAVPCKAIALCFWRMLQQYCSVLHQARQQRLYFSAIWISCLGFHSKPHHSTEPLGWLHNDTKLKQITCKKPNKTTALAGIHTASS